MPARLRDAGVQRAQFDQIASGAMGNIWVRTNPRTIKEQADVINLLDAAW
jgi:alcohol dehydrogenase class IV